MKTLKNILQITVFTVCTTVIAQTTPPKPPAPPATPNRTTSYSSSTNLSNRGNDAGNTSIITQNSTYENGGSTSFSVRNSDDEYRLKSRYPKNRFSALERYLMQEMGSKHLKENGTDKTWILKGGNETVYEIALSDTRLKIELDKTVASSDLIQKFENMGTALKTLISGGDERLEVERLEREANRARRDAERMQREAERLRRTSERNAARYRQDKARLGQEAARVRQEAILLEREAVRLARTSKRGGGIDGYVREVLQQPSTQYDLSTKGTTSWKWPALQNSLLKELQNDGIINEGQNVVFVKEVKDMYVNGAKMEPTLWTKYKNIFQKYEYDRIEELSFYKQGDHIVVLSGPDSLENLLVQLLEKGLLKNLKTESVVQINGTSVRIDGKKLSEVETDRWNNLLHKENVIPAPGKTIKIDAESASIGYSFGKNTLGTWISRN